MQLLARPYLPRRDLQATLPQQTLQPPYLCSFIEQTVHSKNAVIFSKQICPSSRKAKEARRRAVRAARGCGQHAHVEAAATCRLPARPLACTRCTGSACRRPSPPLAALSLPFALLSCQQIIGARMPASDVAVYELDAMPNGSAVQDALEKRTVGKPLYLLVLCACVWCPVLGRPRVEAGVAALVAQRQRHAGVDGREKRTVGKPLCCCVRMLRTRVLRELLRWQAEGRGAGGLGAATAAGQSHSGATAAPCWSGRAGEAYGGQALVLLRAHAAHSCFKGAVALAG